MVCMKRKRVNNDWKFSLFNLRLKESNLPTRSGREDSKEFLYIVGIYNFEYFEYKKLHETHINYCTIFPFLSLLSELVLNIKEILTISLATTTPTQHNFPASGQILLSRDSYSWIYTGVVRLQGFILITWALGGGLDQTLSYIYYERPSHK